MTRLFITLLLIFSFMQAEEKEITFDAELYTLTGDTKTACEVILCLSSAVRPAECVPPIRKFFRIVARKWKDTIKKRRNFLKLCPIGEEAENDPAFRDLRDFVLVNLSDTCDIKKLNIPVSKTSQDSDGEDFNAPIRVNPVLDGSCQKLVNNPYTNFKPKYNCKYTKWYDRSDWKRGYTLENITKEAYELIEDPKQKVFVDSFDEFEPQYFKKEGVEKNCWSI